MDTDFDARSALLVIDVQNDFADPEGSLYVEGGDEIVPTINEAIQAARDAGATVVYTRDWHPPETPHFEKDGGDWPVHCVQDTWGAEFHPKLMVLESGIEIKKGVGGEDGYSGFTIRDPETGEEDPTDLDRTLRQHEVQRVVVCGLAQDVCVHATVMDAVDKGYDTVVLSDATAPVDMQPGDGERAIEDMAEAGAQIR